MPSFRQDPVQLRTREYEYTPYFMPADKYNRFPYCTTMLSSGLNFPAMRTPMPYRERLQLVQQKANQLAEDERKAADFIERTRAANTSAENVTVEDLDFHGRPMTAKALTGELTGEVSRCGILLQRCALISNESRWLWKPTKAPRGRKPNNRSRQRRWPLYLDAER